MEFKIIAPGGDELQHHMLPPVSQYTLPFHEFIGIEAVFGSMRFNHYAGSKFDIWFSNYNIQHDTILKGGGDKPILELHIQFNGSFVNIWDGQHKWLKAYQYNLTYVPHVSNKAQFQAGRDYQTFDIHYDTDYLRKMAPWFPALQNFFDAVDRKEPIDLSPVDRFLTPEMIHVLHTILHCPFSGSVAYFYIESYILILLVLALDQLSLQKPVTVKMDDKTIDGLYYIKDLVVQDFENLPSLDELATKAAMNVCTLKKGFKFLFGDTVFGYMHKIRMAKSKQLLLDTKMTIENIAFTVGYETSKAFEKAFKKHFGFTPAYLRRSDK